MRRFDREMDADFGREVFDRSDFQTITFVSEEPYSLPVSAIRLGETVYYHGARKGKKTELLRQNSQVMLLAVTDVVPASHEFSTEFASVMMWGSASLVDDIDEKIRALRLICERYTPSMMSHFEEQISLDLQNTEVVAVKIRQITAKRKKYGPDGAEIKGTMFKKEAK